jgi:hypothetical protein
MSPQENVTHARNATDASRPSHNSHTPGPEVLPHQPISRIRPIRPRQCSVAELLTNRARFLSPVEAARL